MSMPGCVPTRIPPCRDTRICFSRAQTLSYRAAESSSFLVPEILSMDRELLEQYMAADNGIGHFKRALEIILARRDHTLSGEMEELLAQSYDATQGASQIFTMFNNADVKFPLSRGRMGRESGLPTAITFP